MNFADIRQRLAPQHRSRGLLVRELLRIVAEIDKVSGVQPDGRKRILEWIHRQEQISPVRCGRRHGIQDELRHGERLVLPYTFNGFGGSGATVAPDLYEPDGPKTIDTAKDWATQFQKVKQLDKVISTQDVGQTPSI